MNPNGEFPSVRQPFLGEFSIAAVGINHSSYASVRLEEASDVIGFPVVEIEATTSPSASEGRSSSPAATRKLRWQVVTLIAHGGVRCYSKTVQQF